MQALLFPSQKIPALNLLFLYFKKQNKFTYNFVAHVHSFHQTLNFPLNIPSLKLQRKSEASLTSLDAWMSNASATFAESENSCLSLFLLFIYFKQNHTLNIPFSLNIIFFIKKLFESSLPFVAVSLKALLCASNPLPSLNCATSFLQE